MTGVASLAPAPGAAVLEAQAVVLGELGDVPSGLTGLPGLVHLPGRGPHAGAVGRAGAVLADLPVELGIHGWRLADRPGADVRRARSLLGEDLDALAVAAHGYAGPLVLDVAGPWSLAATLYLARGDRVVADAGAVRELVGALALGLAGLVARVRSAVPGAEPVVVLREPLLAEVIGGGVATFSGRDHLRAVAEERAGTALAQAVAGARGAGAAVVADAGARFVPATWRVLRAGGAETLGVPAQAVGTRDWELVAGAVEDGCGLWFALPEAASRPVTHTDVVALADLVEGPWRAVGLPAAGLRDVVVHGPALPGPVEDERARTAGADVALGLGGLRSGIRAAVRVAAELAERAER